MQEPYENVYLGAFIFALGMAAGKAGKTPKNTFAQLLQQTPGDKKLGDLLAAWGGRNFIFEFKRRESGLQTEHKKSYCNKHCLEDCNDHRNFIFDYLSVEKYENQRKLSLKGHFAAFGGENEEGDADLLFMPYAEIRGAKKQGERTSLSKFVSSLQSDTGGFGLNDKDFKSYYEFLCACVDESSGSLTGVVINVGDDGQLNCVQLAEIGDLVANMQAEDRPIERAPYDPSSPRMRLG